MDTVLVEVPITRPEPSPVGDSPQTLAMGSTGSVALAPSSSRTLIWSLAGETRAELALHLVEPTSTHESQRAVVKLPAAATSGVCGGLVAGEPVVFAVAGRAALCKVSVKVEEAGTEDGGPRRRLDIRVEQVDFASQLPATASVTSVLLLEGRVCLGCDSGAVLVLDAAAPEANGAQELRPSGGLSLPSLFSRRAPGVETSAVVQLLAYNYLEHAFLGVLHANSQLRLWDLGSRAAVQTVDLLPPEAAARTQPRIAALIEEPVDAASSVLAVFFAPLEAGQPGQLHTYTIMMEQRGDHSFKVHAETGARLESTMVAVHDLRLARLGRHDLGLWALYYDLQGALHLLCLPVAFVETQVRPAAAARLLTDALDEATAQAETTKRLWRGVWAGLGDAPLDMSAPVLQRACQNLFMASPCALRPVLRASLEAIRVIAPAEEMSAVPESGLMAYLARKLEVLCFKRGPGALLDAWLDLAAAYVECWKRHHAPCGLAYLAWDPDAPLRLVIVRQGGLLSVLESAERAERLPGAQDCPEETRTVVAALWELRKLTGGGIFLWLLQACMEQGYCPLRVARAASSAIAGAGLGACGGPSTREVDFQAASAWRQHARKLALLVRSLGSRSAAVVQTLGGAFGVREAPLTLALTERAEGSLDHCAAVAALGRLPQAAGGATETAWLALLLCQALLDAPGTGESDCQALRRAQPGLLRALSLAGAWFWAAVWGVDKERPQAQTEPAAMIRSLQLRSGAAKRSKRTIIEAGRPVDVLLQRVPSELFAQGGGGAARQVVQFALRGGMNPACQSWVSLAQALLHNEGPALAGRFLRIAAVGVPSAQLIWRWMEGIAAESSSEATQMLVVECFRVYMESGDESKNESLRNLALILGKDEHRFQAQRLLKTLALWLEHTDAKGAAASVALAAAQSVRRHISDADEGRRTSEHLWSVLFALCLAKEDVEGMYIASISAPVAAQAKLAKELVLSCQSASSYQNLARLPFADVTESNDKVWAWTTTLEIVVSTLMLRATSELLSYEPNLYNVCYRILMDRQCFGPAASCMHTYAARLLEEAAGSEGMLRKAVEALQIVVSTASAMGTRASSSKFDVGPVVDLPTAQATLARAKAWLAASSANIDPAGLQSDIDLIRALLAAEYFTAAWTFSESLPADNNKDMAQLHIVELMSRKAATASVSGGSDSDGLWEHVRRICEGQSKSVALCSAATDGLFAVSSKIEVPFWLRNCMLASPETFMRQCMEYQRIETAAEVAHVLLDRWTRNEVALLPYTLLEKLVAQLRDSKMVEKAEDLSRRIAASLL